MLASGSPEQQVPAYYEPTNGVLPHLQKRSRKLTQVETGLVLISKSPLQSPITPVPANFEVPSVAENWDLWVRLDIPYRSKGQLNNLHF